MGRKNSGTLWKAILVGLGGAATIVAAWMLGLSTGWFLVHDAYPLGFWLVFEGLALRLGLPALLRRPVALVVMILVGTLLGLVLDFYMVYLTKVLDLRAVSDTGIALQMYLGWGFCMPAVYQSYRVSMAVISRASASLSTRKLTLPGWTVAPLGLFGFALAEVPLFFRLWVGVVPGYLIVVSFVGFWLIAEHIHLRRNRPSLLSNLLQFNPLPLLAMFLASLPFTLIWESLNYLMGSWRYQNIFLLEPALAGVPLVVFVGYFCGYYVLFLSVYDAVRTEDEADLPVFQLASSRAVQAESPLPSKMAD